MVVTILNTGVTLHKAMYNDMQYLGFYKTFPENKPHLGTKQATCMFCNLYNNSLIFTRKKVGL